jgi:hypothetical protein
MVPAGWVLSAKPHAGIRTTSRVGADPKALRCALRRFGELLDEQHVTALTAAAGSLHRGVRQVHMAIA